MALYKLSRSMTVGSIRANQYRGYSIRASSPLSVLVLDGYAKDGREELLAGGASTAGTLYESLIKKCTPLGAVECTIAYPADPSFTTPDLSQFHAVAWTGCSLTIHETNDIRVMKQIRLAQEIFAYGLPQYGSCWAAQIAVAASNGVCNANPQGREMGIARKITLSSEGRAHPMFYGKSTVFDAFTSHSDEITHVQPGTLILAGNSHSNIQAVAVKYLKGEFWGVQYHPEYDLHELARLTYCRREKLMNLGFFNSIKAADAYVDELETLHKDPSRKDIAWRLGIDADVMHENIRLCETRNFIKFLALPYKEVMDKA